MTLESIVASPVVEFLAFAGGVVLVMRLLKSMIRGSLAATEIFAMRALAETSLRHGDLTGMAERKDRVRAAHRRRLRALAFVLLWLAVLVVPLVFALARPVYALASVLWLLPGARVRFTVRTRARADASVTTSTADAARPLPPRRPGDTSPSP